MKISLTHDEMNLPVQFKGGVGSGMVGHTTLRQPGHVHVNAAHTASNASDLANRLTAAATKDPNKHVDAGQAHLNAAMMHRHAGSINPNSNAYHTQMANRHAAQASHHFIAHTTTASPIKKPTISKPMPARLHDTSGVHSFGLF